MKLNDHVHLGVTGTAAHNRYKAGAPPPPRCTSPLSAVSAAETANHYQPPTTSSPTTA